MPHHLRRTRAPSVILGHRRLGLLAVLAALVPVACGSGDHRLSAADYRLQGDAACAQVFTYNHHLPQLARERHLTIGELQRLADENGRRFIARMRSLRPPANLVGAHARVLALLSAPSSSNLAALIARERRFRDADTAATLDGCAALAQRTIAQLSAAAHPPR
jgi:hypothetical protein